MHHPKTGPCNKDLQRPRNRNKKKWSKNSAHRVNDTTSDTVTEPDAVLQGYHLQVKYWQTVSKAKGRGRVQETLLVGPHVPWHRVCCSGEKPRGKPACHWGATGGTGFLLVLQVPAHAQS